MAREPSEEATMTRELSEANDSGLEATTSRFQRCDLRIFTRAFFLAVLLEVSYARLIKFFRHNLVFLELFRHTMVFLKSFQKRLIYFL